MRKLTMLYRAFSTPEQETRLRRFLLEKKSKKEDINLIAENRKFKNIHKGERCFIIGNGPSLKRVDLSCLRDEQTFTVNQSPRMRNFSDICTNYHIWVDERFFTLDRKNPSDMELLDVMRKVRTQNNNPVVFYKIKAREMVSEFGLDKQFDIKYIMDGVPFMDTFKVDLSIDRPIPVFATCIHYAILIAVYMGFSKIYLLGCDCTGIINIINARKEEVKNFEYVYEISNNERKRMQQQNTKTSLADEILFYSYLLKAYGILCDYCKIRGVEIYNATEGSILEEVPKVRLEDVIKHDK